MTNEEFKSKIPKKNLSTYKLPGTDFYNGVQVRIGKKWRFCFSNENGRLLIGKYDTNPFNWTRANVKNVKEVKIMTIKDNDD